MGVPWLLSPHGIYKSTCYQPTCGRECGKSICAMFYVSLKSRFHSVNITQHKKAVCLASGNKYKTGVIPALFINLYNGVLVILIYLRQSLALLKIFQCVNVYSVSGENIIHGQNETKCSRLLIGVCNRRFLKPLKCKANNTPVESNMNQTVIPLVM